MKQKRQQTSRIFLILGIVFLVLGISTDITTFSWVSVAFIIISLAAGGRWLRPRIK